MKTRIAADLSLFLSIFWLPWWAAAGLAIVFIFAFEWYYEAIAAGFLSDIVYSVSLPHFWNVRFAGTVALALALALALYAKSKLKFY